MSTTDDFASTLGHELAHATCHPSRLNRKFNSKVFKENYAQEECVAALASCYLCAHLGFSYVDAHGAAVIERKEQREMFGEKQEYLVLRMAHGDLISWAEAVQGCSPRPTRPTTTYSTSTT